MGAAGGGGGGEQCIKDFFFFFANALPPNHGRDVANTACLLGPAPTWTGTIALDPTFGSFTLLEPISH
jgi:hypothetical protein